MTTNRRFQFLSGLNYNPLKDFWMLGNLTDMDPDIPNLPLEATVVTASTVNFGWYQEFPRLPRRQPKRFSDTDYYPLGQVDTPVVTLTLGWLDDFVKPKITRARRDEQTSFIPTLPAVVVVTDFGWDGFTDKPIIQKIARVLNDVAWPFGTISEVVVTATDFGWQEQLASTPVRKRGRSFNDTTDAYPQQPLSFGWFESFAAIRPYKKQLRPTDVTFFNASALATSFGWFEPFPKPLIRKARGLDQITEVSTFASLVITNFGWDVPYPTPVKPYQRTTLALHNFEAPYFGSFTPVVVVPPSPPPGPISDLYPGPSQRKKDFWKQVYAAGVRKGPNNVSGRIRR